MKPKSDNLFHFTKSLDVLKLILKNGLEPRYCLEDTEWLSIKYKYMAYAMSCFCDIPLSRINEHTDFYGNYGIGLSKEWGLKNGLNPVVYIPSDGEISKLARYLALLNPFNDDVEKEKELADNWRKLITLSKPLTGTMLVAGKPVEKEFYQENEWRYVPNIDNFIPQEDYDVLQDEANINAKKYTLKFTPSDIKYIFVHNDSEIPNLFDFITTNLGDYPLNDIKILQSRIVSLSTISMDI